MQVHLRVSSSRILQWFFLRERRKRWIFMAEPTGPGPGRSTAEAAFNEVRREVARRNEEAHKAAQKLRAEKERLRLAERRKWDRD
jgi:hypothetical protein